MMMTSLQRTMLWFCHQSRFIILKPESLILGASLISIRYGLET